jgi:hypothetical protein
MSKTFGGVSPVAAAFALISDIAPCREPAMVGAGGTGAGGFLAVPPAGPEMLSGVPSLSFASAAVSTGAAEGAGRTVGTGTSRTATAPTLSMPPLPTQPDKAAVAESTTKKRRS